MPFGSPQGDAARDSFLSTVQDAAFNVDTIVPAQVNGGSGGSGDGGGKPWQDVAWFYPELDTTRWNKLYPYKFIVLEASHGSNGKTNYSESPNWSFTLPFPPESVNISVPYAIDLGATLGGIHAQHNGVVFKNIQISGTTGVVPLKGAAPPKQFSIATSIFGGTIDQISRTVGSAIALVGGTVDQNVVSDQSFQSEQVIGRTTGYAQTLLLEQFLSNYATMKRSSKGAKYRLAFAQFKEQKVWLVEPISFNMGKSAGSVYEYPYQIQLKAYGQAETDISVNPGNEFRPAVLDANALGLMMQSIQKARETVYNGQQILRAVAGDIDNFFFEPVRKLSLFMKEVASSSLTFADFPKAILSSCKSTVIAYIGLQESTGGLVQSYKDVGPETVAAVEAILELVRGSNKSDVRTGNPYRPNNAPSPFFNQLNESDPANFPFKNPNDYFEFFNSIPPAAVNLPPEAVRAMNNERRQVMKLRRADFEEMRDNFVTFLTDFEASVGAGDTTYSDTYQTGQTSNPDRTPSEEDFELIFAINDLIEQTSKLACTNWTDRNQITGMDYVAGLAKGSGIAFKVPVSKFLVPFPYGSSLEDLARTYLGTPDRWLEIAQLNGLRTPYVDEVGFSLPLLADGNLNSVTVASSENLYVNQLVWLSSNTANKTQRHIVGIESFLTHCVITLDGDADLGDYEYLAGAALHAFLPATVNSMQVLYIPSDVQVDNDLFNTKDLPGVDDFDPLVLGGGTDLLLDSSNDLIFTNDGDCPLAIGLANVIQNTRIRLTCVQGELNRHPLFGLPIRVGGSVADLTIEQLGQAVRNLFSDDPNYASVSNVAIAIKAPAAKISFNLDVPRYSSSVPVFFDMEI